MRVSRSGLLRLDLSSAEDNDARNLDAQYGIFIHTADTMAHCIRHHLELSDNIETIECGSDNNSLLYKTVMELIALDSRYLQSQKKYFGAAIEKTVKKGEADLRDGMIFSKRGARKTDIEAVSIRRMSFAATSYCDTTEILKVTRLAEMTDLEFLFSLNAYHLPYANSTPRRTMYQNFFDVFIREVVDLSATQHQQEDEEKIEEAHLFGILQETIYMLHMATEYTVSIVACIFEMIAWVNPRLKSIPMSINLKLPAYNGASSPLLDHLTRCFGDGNKVFNQFSKRRLIHAINELREDEIKDWKGRLQNYGHSLDDAFEPYIDGCDRFLDSVKKLHQDRDTMFEGPGKEDIERRQEIDVYLTDVELYIDQTRAFILLLSAEQSVYRQFYQSAIDLLDLVDRMQEKYPIRYGGSVTPRGPRSPRTPPKPRSQTNSNNGSPRGGVSNEHDTIASHTAESKSFLSRIASSVLGSK